MIPNGYKKTEIGVIPLDWEVVKLGDIAELTSSKRVHLADYVDNGIPFYRGKEITLLKKNKAIDDLLYISEEQYNKIKNQFGIPQKNDILITAVGTLANTYRISNDNPFYFKDGNLIWLKEITQNSIYLDYILEFHKKQILDSAIGSSQKALTIKELKNLKIPLPPLPQQKKIAQILSTADEKIEAIALQIEKAEMVKKGLMQRLLNNESWEEILLEELLSFKNGVNASKEQYGKGYKFINVLDIINNLTIKYDDIIGSVDITEKEFELYEVKYGDILFQRSSETRAEVGQSNVYLDKEKSATFGGFVIKGSPKQEYNPIFMNYLFKIPAIRKQITSKSGGSTRYNIGQNSLNQVLVQFPPLKEQTQIANILSTADEKLEVLRAKKAKYEELKVGLMQKLLTGEVRV